MSFSRAQFEREVTGALIRAKIAASKAEGGSLTGNVEPGTTLPVHELL
jgi:hypothetical protein